jgi:nicotinamidase-related amidase
MKIQGEREMKALLLIDIQKDYFPGGRMELYGSEVAGARAGALLQACREKRLPVFHVQHLAAGAGATFFLPGTEGVEFHEAVLPLPGESVTQKHYPSAFRDTDLYEKLKKQGVSELVITGMMTHMCVDTTVRTACDLGFVCTLAHDGCATKTLSFGGRDVVAPQVQAAYLAALDGTFARVAGVADICAEL